MDLSREEKQFLKEIESDLDDDSARLVYADWLEERGDNRGEYLRLEYELSSGRGISKDLDEVVARTGELVAQIDPSWLALVSRSAIEGCFSHFIENRNCPGRWRALQKTDTPTIRLCDNCKLAVHFCTEIEEASWFVNQARNKTAVESSLERSKNDLFDRKLIEQVVQETNEELNQRTAQGQSIQLAAFGNSAEDTKNRWRRNP